MRYYIADCHFFHRGLNEKMDKRGFADTDEMNEYMIRKWNQKVRPKDEVVILGDLSMEKGERTNEILRRLHGRLYLIEGNHDYYLKDSDFERERFVWIRPYAEMKDNKRTVVLCHYPVFCYHGQYRKDQEGNARTYMMYGHVYVSFDEVLVSRFVRETQAARRVNMYTKEEESIPCNMLNCFCMYSDYEPLSLDEWIENNQKRREKLAYGDETP